MISENGIVINGKLITPKMTEEQLKDAFGEKVTVFTDVKKPHLKTIGVSDLYKDETHTFSVAVVISSFNEPSYIKLTKLVTNPNETEQEKFTYYLQWLNKISDNKADMVDKQVCSYLNGNIVFYLWKSNFDHCHSIRIYNKI